MNPLNAELNPICQFLALLGDYPILDVSCIRVKEFFIIFFIIPSLMTSLEVALGEHKII